MIGNVYGIYAEIMKKNSIIKVKEFNEEFEPNISPLQTPIGIEGGVAFTRPFFIRFGVLLTVNNEMVVLKLDKSGKLEDFNDSMSSVNLLFEAFKDLNLQLAVIDEESEQRILIVPENSGEITPYFDAVSEMQALALKKINPVLKYFEEDYQIARPSKKFKDKMTNLKVTGGLLQEDTIEAIVLPDERRNTVHIVYPLDVRLDPDEVAFISIDPPGQPVFTQRLNSVKFIRASAFSERVRRALSDFFWPFKKERKSSAHNER